MMHIDIVIVLACAGFVAGAIAGLWAGKRVLAARMRKVADQIDVEYPKPHFDGTVGEAHGKLAEQLRTLADKWDGGKKA